AHHAPAKSWQATINALTCKGAKCLGVTATPERNKSVGLGEVFDELCFTRSLVDLIPKYLCDLRVVRVETQLELDGVRSRQGDFMVRDLDKAVNRSDRNQLVVESWMRYGENRPAVVYCVSVEHAIALAESFSKFDIPAQAVHGKQTPQQRQSTLAQFRAGQLSIVTNCQVLTEGWDCPHLQCLVMARPTQSSLLFSQIVGRGTRKSKGKKDCLVLDIADNTKRHKLQTVHRLFGLAPTVDLSQIGAAKQAKLREEAEIQRLRDEAAMLERMDRVIVDLLLDADTSLPSRYGWTPLAGGCWFIKIPEQEPDCGGDLLQIRYDTDSGATLLWISETKMRELAAAPSLQHLVEIADEWIETHLRFTVILLDRKANWRDHPASESQKSYIRTLLRKVSYFDTELYETLSDRLRHIESAELLSDFYDAQGASVPHELEQRRLTKGTASQLISFLKERLAAY
ncbi:MAG: helicase-related protein, partial [Cyanobacteria bacterium J06648_11]